MSLGNACKALVITEILEAIFLKTDMATLLTSAQRVSSLARIDSTAWEALGSSVL